MNNIMILYEELSLNAWSSLQTQFYDGWVLRYTDGYEHPSRANAVSLLYPSTIDLHEKITECEKRYITYGSPPIFKITEDIDMELDKLLDEKDYTIASPTYMMTADIKSNNYAIGDCLISNKIDNEWLEAYFSLNEYDDNAKIIVKRVFDNIRVPVLCGMIIKNDLIIACGLCVIERGFAGLFNITVDEQYRGNGYGTIICESLLATAKEQGVHTSYLQVLQDNKKAINLYTKLGYNTLYSYWYRENKGDI